MGNLSDSVTRSAKKKYERWKKPLERKLIRYVKGYLNASLRLGFEKWESVWMDCHSFTGYNIHSDRFKRVVKDLGFEYHEDNMMPIAVKIAFPKNIESIPSDTVAAKLSAEYKRKFDKRYNLSESSASETIDKICRQALFKLKFNMYDIDYNTLGDIIAKVRVKDFHNNPELQQKLKKRMEIYGFNLSEIEGSCFLVFNLGK